METDIRVDEANSSSGCQQDLESEEFSALLRQQKYLNNLTEHALRKGQPLIILNLLHEKDSLLNAEDLAGTSRMEQMCLQALSMRMFPGGPPTEISLDNEQDHDREACLSSGKSCITPVSTPTAIPDSDLPTIVSPYNLILSSNLLGAFWSLCAIKYQIFEVGDDIGILFVL